MDWTRRLSIWALFAGVFVLCSPAADAKGFYFGASVGQADARDLDLTPVADGSSLTGGTDGSDAGWKLFGGFKVLNFLNAEVAYRDYGQASFTATSDGTGTIYAPGPVEAVSDTTAVSLTAMVVVPAGRMKFFAKTGAARWRTETTIRHSLGNVANRESDGVDPMYGGGFAWMLKRSTGVRVEYERILADTADRDFFSVGVHFKF